ncbi:hypothetical protein H310_14369 [Aphanomyces invadans]|uniref:WRKY19-like zinc finger domain-containing protein n=1 Tax=Aphanomyces invadans TaxID=157072 RepID=A0A024T9Z9_9STRA|nr:hypothetical protein H310_14369 [Aphanomyces invadans]ETV90955.1 hypothetical protein H310_14369 [Aphanomyces invadans]|eukprot:XP_008880437.1 hypothetical protein H310_14369 [Aphanomyces invadans]
MVFLPPLTRLSSQAHGFEYSTPMPPCKDNHAHSLQRCAIPGCSHFAKLHYVCLVHARQSVPSTLTTSPANSSSAPKRRNKKCQVDQCGSFARSGGFCTRHGGGRKCKAEGCTTASQTGGYCRIHGGGSKCKVENCDQFARAQGMCLPHSRSRKAA